MPPTGLTKDAGWEIGVSRTLPVPADRLWEFLTGDEGRALWLGHGTLVAERGAAYRTTEGTTGEVRGTRSRPGGGLRLTRRPPDGPESTLQITVTPAASSTAKSVLRFHEERLSSAEEREERRRHWKAVADAVTTAVS
jgi:uncharacterized protein YndB with AHSA1/START domain